MKTLSLKKITVKNIKISAGLALLSKALGTITSIILARMLLPTDFGIITIVYLFMGALNLFTEFGFGAAVIHRKEQVEEALNTSFTFNLVISIVLYLVVIVTAPFLATFYDNPALTPVTRVLAIGIILSAFQFAPSVYLRKDLKFKSMAAPSLISGLTTSIVGISLAFLGFGYWSLVWASLASTLVNVLILLKICPCKPKISFNKKIAKDLFGYGKYLFVANFIIFINLNIDNAIGGKMLGLTALGYYYLAYRWGNFSQQVSGITEKVMFPTYSKIRDNIPRLREGYLKVLKYMSVLTFPVSMGLFALSNEFVIVILGEKWIPSITPMRILCFSGLFSSLAGTTGSIFSAIGKPKLVRDLSSIMTLILLIFIYPMTLYWGIIGLSLVVTISSIISSTMSFYYILKILDLGLTQYFDAIKYSTIATLISLVATLVVKHSFSSWHISSNQTILISSFLTFTIVYLIVLYLTDKKIILELIQLAKPTI